MKYISNKVFIISFFIILTQIFLSFKGLRINYDIYNYEKLQNFYNNDIFFNKEGAYSTLLYYLLPFNLNNDFYGLIIHVIFSLIGFYYSYKIIKNIFKIPEEYSLFLIILLGVISHFVLPEVKSQLAYPGFSWGSSYAHSLSFALIYFTLIKSFYVVPLIFISTLISFKFSFIVSIFCISFFLKDLKKDYKIILFSSLALILSTTILFLRTKNHINYASLENVTFVIQNYISLQNSESFILSNNLINLFIFMNFIFLYIFLIKKLKLQNNIKFFLELLLSFSIILLICNSLFTLYFYKFFSSVNILIVDAIIFLKFFQFFLIILILKFLLIKKINYFSILILFFCIMSWRWSNDYDAVVSKKIVIFIFIIFLLSLFFNLKLKKINLLKENYLIILSTLIILFPFFFTNLKFIINNLNVKSINEFNKFYYPEKNQIFLKFLKDLKNVSDFEMLYIKKKKDLLKISTDENFLTKKSKFTLTHRSDCRLFTYYQINQCFKRIEYVEKLLKNTLIFNEKSYNNRVVIFCECRINNKIFKYKTNIEFQDKVLNIYTNNFKTYNEIQKIIFN